MGNKWIQWRGGDCPVPIDTWIDIKCKDGSYHAGCLALRGAIVDSFCWEGPDPYIVKYRFCAPRSNPHKGKSRKFWLKKMEKYIESCGD